MRFLPTAHTAFHRLHRRTGALAEIAYETLREAILSGTLQAQQRLNERQLARELRISPAPVKTALQRLAHEGFVTIRPRHGTYVLGFASLQETCLLRAALEGVAARLAAQKANADHMRALEEQLQVMHHFTTEAYSADSLVAANTRFHDLVHEASQNPHIARLLSPLRVVNMAVRRRALSQIAEARRGLREHHAVFRAIAGRDPEAAEQRMRAHIMRTILDVTRRVALDSAGGGTDRTSVVESTRGNLVAAKRQGRRSRRRR